MTLSYSDFDQHLIDDDLGLFTQQRMTAFGKSRHRYCKRP